MICIQAQRAPWAVLVGPWASQWAMPVLAKRHANFTRLMGIGEMYMLLLCWHLDNRHSTDRRG